MTNLLKRIFNIGSGLLSSRLLGSKLLGGFTSGKIFAGRGYGLSDLLMYAILVDEGVILQTDGSFLCAFWFRGSDLETTTDEELSILSHQLNDAFNLLGSGWLFHIDIIRYQATGYTNITDCYFNNATLRLIDAKRRALYMAEASHYENSYMISFTYKPRVDLGSRLGLFFKNNEINFDTDTGKNGVDYDYYLRQFKDKLNEVIALLTQQLNIVQMNSQELLSYLSWCITGEFISLSIPLNYGVFLKHYLASADLVGGDSPKIGDKHIRAITIMGFPSESYAGILDKLNHMNFEYRFNTRFIMIDQYEGSKIINRISNLWYQKRISAMDTVKMSLAIESNIKINQNSETQYMDAEKANKANDAGGIKFGFYTATVIVTNDDCELAQRHANQIRTLLRNLGFQSQIERHHSLEAYLGSLPGYAYANVRKWLIHTQNLADIMPNTSIWSGLTHNPCSLYQDNNPPLFYARTNGLTPMRISLHVGDNGHTLILGPVGSGKSTLLNFIIAQHFRYRNARVFIFDKNRSSLPLCYGCNGEFYDIGAANNTTYFQPLVNLETDLDFGFALSWLEEICRLNGMGDNFLDSHRAAIRRALHLMRSETPYDRRTLSYFRYLVQDYDQSIAAILEGFSSEFIDADSANEITGLVARIFDAAYDSLSFNNCRFNVFEMGKLMELGDRVVIPALRYLMHAISKQFDSAEPTLMVFDESFLFFRHPLFREKIIDWIKTVRKFNVAIIFATQELADLFNYDELKSAIINNCATKIFLSNRRALDAGIYEQYQAMSLNDKQINLISHGFLGEYFYVSELGNRKFNLDLNKDQVTFAFTARNSHKDIQRAIKLKIEHGDQFAYYWLKECGVNDSVLQEWLEFQS